MVSGLFFLRRKFLPNSNYNFCFWESDMKMHILKDNNLIQLVDNPYFDLWTLDDINRFNWHYPKTIPTDAYAFVEANKNWYVKRTGKRVQLVLETLVPKELKVILLVLGVPQ